MKKKYVNGLKILLVDIVKYWKYWKITASSNIISTCPKLNLENWIYIIYFIGYMVFYDSWNYNANKDYHIDLLHDKDAIVS